MSTTSSSRRRPRITVSSRRAFAGALALALAGACGRGAGETFVTSFNGAYGVSVRYPAGWRTDQAEQEGMWYRYFLAPPAGPTNKAAVSVTLLAGPLETAIDEYALSYLAGNDVLSSREESRQGASGREWSFASPDGATRHRLLLVAREGRVYGLYAQGEAAAFASRQGTLDEMWTSFALEIPALYPVKRWPDADLALGVPTSWREIRRFSGRGKLLVQFASPPLAVDEGQPINASLTITVEPVAGGGTLAEYYETTRTGLGENFAVVSHEDWGDGFVDVMRTETPLAVSYVRRFYRVHEGRGCSLAFEARDDVFSRVEAWADLIASTLAMGAAPEAGR